MNLSVLGQRALGQSKLYLIKNGPAILTGAGILGFVGTTVLVAKAAVKAKPEYEAMKYDLEVIEQRVPDSDYPQKEKGKDYAIAILRGSREIAKIYAPAIIVGAVSVTCIVSAHGMLRKQNMGLVAAYGALDAGFKAYRRRVVEEFGEEKDRDIFRGVVSRREGTDDEGKPCVIEEVGINVPASSIYGKFFDEYSSYYSPDAEYNLTYLVAKENWCNDRLISRGHMFLNEVYQELGIPETRCGQVVGWRYYSDGNNPNGDNYISFGMVDLKNQMARAFINGHERAIYLNFNVDGVIVNSLDD